MQGAPGTSPIHKAPKRITSCIWTQIMGSGLTTDCRQQGGIIQH